MLKRVLTRCLHLTFIMFACVSCGAPEKISQTTSSSQAPSATALVQTPIIKRVVSYSVDYAADEHDLVDRSTLIIVGVPIGSVEEVPLPDPDFASYRQDVRVLEVLKGNVVGNTVRILGSGLSRTAQAEGVIVSEDLGGPLPNGKHILFLSPSGLPNVQNVVGLTSGRMPLSASERVTVMRPEVKGFEGLDIAAVKQKIQELGKK